MTTITQSLEAHLVNRYGLRIYNQLCDAGADLPYIWYLDVYLDMGDINNELVREEFRKVKKLCRRKLPKELPELPTLLQQESVSFMKDRILKLLRNKQEEEEKKHKEELDAYYKQNPIAEVFKAYFNWPGKYKKGGSEDLRGSFFLLAVTVHLKNFRGRYLLASRLLKAIRGTEGKERRRVTAPRELAMKRTQRLRKIRPDFEAHLQLLTKHYRAL